MLHATCYITTLNVALQRPSSLMFFRREALIDTWTCLLLQTHPIHYLDHGSIQSSRSEWIEALGKIEDLLEHGKTFVHTLYTFRCVSRAIPLVRS